METKLLWLNYSKLQKQAQVQHKTDQEIPYPTIEDIGPCLCIFRHTLIIVAALRYGLSKYRVDRLHTRKIQNAATRVLFQIPKFDFHTCS